METHNGGIKPEADGKPLKLRRTDLSQCLINTSCLGPTIMQIPVARFLCAGKYRGTICTELSQVANTPHSTAFPLIFSSAAQTPSDSLSISASG